MHFRSKLFLTFLSFGVTPLVLLALLNYWSSLRGAERQLEKIQQRDLAYFISDINDLLVQEKTELTKLARSRNLIDYVESSEENKVEGSIRNTSDSQTLAASPPTDRSTVSGAVQALVSSVLNNPTHTSSIAVFDINKRQLFLAQPREFETYQTADFRTKDFLSSQSRPDERVWTTNQPGVLISSVATAPSGTYVVFTAPIIDDQRGNKLTGALVAELSLDPVFLEVAREDKNNGMTLANLFIVLDRSGRILYHTNEAVKNQPVDRAMPSFSGVANRMLSSDSGKDTFISAAGNNYSVVFARIPNLDLFVARATTYDDALAGAHRMGVISLIAAVLFAFMAAVVLTFYWQKKSRGIERVSEGVEAIARGELDHRIDLRSRDDLKPLADNVALMTRQLRDQIAREAETRQFQSFVRLSAILTHDLKNSIEALSLTVSNMERHFENPDFRADAMKTLRGATENLRSLVARLSNPVTTLSGEHKLPQSVDLVPMLRRVCSMTAGTMHTVEIKLPESLWALVDVERMDKVVENLIINARESMNGKAGTITVEGGKTAEGKPFFSIRDTGEGMSARFIAERLFRPFATTKKRGVGLGLYTCREVVRANGGSIEVNSQQGVGTTFLVVLPSAPLDKVREN